MTQNKIRLLTTSLAIFALISCTYTLKIKRGNGEIDSKEYRLESFDKINIGGNYKIKLYPSDEPKVFIETDENLFEYFEIEVHGEELYINSDYNLKPTDAVNMEIYYPKLDRIILTGASSIEHRAELESYELEISLTGAGSIDFNLDVDDLEVSISGAGLVKLEGEVFSQVIHSSGAGSIEARDLESRYAEIHISGAGNAEVHATRELVVHISGMGNVKYYGDPDEIEQNITGLGKVKRGEDRLKRDDENL